MQVVSRDSQAHFWGVPDRLKGLEKALVPIVRRRMSDSAGTFRPDRTIGGDSCVSSRVECSLFHDGLGGQAPIFTIQSVRDRISRPLPELFLGRTGWCCKRGDRTVVMIDAMPRGSAREKTKASQRDSGGMSLATLGWYLFCFMMPLGNTTLSVLVFGVALGIGLKEPENRRALARILRGNRVAQAMTLFVCILFVSAAFSSHKTLALAGAFGYSLVILLPLLAGLLWNIPTADWILSRGLVCLGLGGLISASVALYRAYVLHVWRPGGAFISTNGFASVIMLTLLISWWGMTVPDVRQSIWLRLCRLGNWLIMLWSFIMAQGRGAWVGFAVGFVLYNLRSLRGVVAVVATSAFCLLGIRGNPRLVQRFLSILAPSAYTVRIWIWQGSLAMWRDHPLLGIGPGTFMHEFETYRPIEAIEGGFTYPVSFAHNLFLGLLTEVGVLGTAAFLIILAAVAHSVWRWMQTVQTGSVSRMLVWALSCTLFALIVREMVDNTIFGLEVGGAFWALLTWLAVLTRTGESEAEGT